MMQILEKIQLTKANKNFRNVFISNIRLLNYTDNLYKSLLMTKHFERLEKINQLGSIRVKKKDVYTRKDYVMLQLYINYIAHDIENLEYTYSGKFSKNEFESDFPGFENEINKKDDPYPTLGEVMQCLIISYNIGHFYNTFTGSRALMAALKTDLKLKEKFLAYFKNSAVSKNIEKLIGSDRYYDIHLFNGILILMDLENQNLSVRLTQRILELYLQYLVDDSVLQERLKYTFKLFRSIRNISYAVYDLHIAPISLSLSINNQADLRFLLNEYISEYNNTKPVKEMVNTINKLLSDSVYNEPNNLLRQTYIANKIMKRIEKSNLPDDVHDYINNFVLKSDSYINDLSLDNLNIDECNILKFKIVEKEMKIIDLVKRINSMCFIHASYYYRNDNSTVVCVGIKNTCTNKKVVSLEVVRLILNFLNSNSITHEYERNLLIIKFFLYYLFNENKFRIVNHDKLNSACVFYERGKLNRIRRISKYLKEINGVHQDILHEVEWMRDVLSNDSKNDGAILIPASIKIYKSDSKKMLNEFDGLIIFPNRKLDQVVFLEAKNNSNTNTNAINDLNKKLFNINIDINSNNYIILNSQDIGYKYTIQKDVVKD